MFIGSLPYRFTEGELLDLFVSFGRIISLKIMHNQWGKSRGIGYVEFDNLESAIAAKSKLHNHFLEDRTIIVDFAQPDPFKTPEGLARHEEALRRKPIRRPVNRNTEEKDDRKPRDSKFSNHPRDGKFAKDSFKKKLVGGPKQRQSIFDSRNFHSRVGAKFASKSKKK